MNDNEHPFTPAALAKTTATANRAATVRRTAAVEAGPQGRDPGRRRSRGAGAPRRRRLGVRWHGPWQPQRDAAHTCGRTVAPERPRRANRRALAATVGVAAGALMLLADAGPAFAGLNLGNHNETLLTPAAVAKPSDRRRVARRLAMSALVVAASFGVTAAFVNDGTSNTRHSAFPGNYCSSSGGGGRNCPQRP